MIYIAHDCTIGSAQTHYQAQLRKGMQRLQRCQKVGNQLQLCIQVLQIGQCTYGGLRCCRQLLQSSHGSHMLKSVIISG